MQDAINSASTVAQTLGGEVLEGQRKLLSLAAAGANSSAMLRTECAIVCDSRNPYMDYSYAGKRKKKKKEKENFLS